MTATIKVNASKINEEIFTIEVPKMEGSEKQIAWAEKIFVDVLRSLCEMCAGKMDNEKIKAQYDMIIEKLSTQTSAKFWIDNRCCTFSQIYKSL